MFLKINLCGTVSAIQYINTDKITSFSISPSKLHDFTQFTIDTYEGCSINWLLTKEDATLLEYAIIDNQTIVAIKFLTQQEIEKLKRKQDEERGCSESNVFCPSCEGYHPI